MKKIKKMLIEEANKQEIHDLQDRILRNVDQSKVRPDVIFTPTVRKNKLIFASKIALAGIGAGLLVLVGLSIGWMSNTQGINNNPTEIVPDKTDVLYKDEATLRKYLDAISKQEAFNIINVAPSLKNLNFSDIELDTDSKNMTESERVGLVNDLNFQIYNIYEMLGLTEVDTTRSVNPYKDNLASDFYGYSENITCTGELSSYQLYFNENVISQKNVGEVNVKVKADMEGKINAIDNIYAFSGNMEYKNGKTIYTTSIAVGEYSVNVKEIFGSGLNEFRYEYNRIKKNLDGTTDVELLREINIKQDFDSEGNIKKIEFSNDYTNIHVEKKNILDDNIITFKIGSRNSDELTVKKTDTGYSYSFKNNSAL